MYISEVTTSPPEQNTSDRLGAALSVLDLCRRAARAHDRGDLVTRVDAVGRRLGEPTVKTLVVGEFKNGKSALVNGLLTGEICPTDNALATAVPTVLSFGPDFRATAVYEPAADANGGEDGEPRRVPIELNELRDLALEADHNGDRALRGIEVEVPRRLLEEGVVLVDTPGIGGLTSRHGGATATALSNAEAVVFVTDAGQELTATEAEFLGRARRACPTLAVALTKIDMYPQWRQVLELDRGHLDAIGIDAPIFPLSSAIRDEAIAEQSRELSVESGFPELVGWLRGVTADVQGTSIEGAITHLADVVGQLTHPVIAEREALLAPDAAEDLLTQLEEAEERAKELQRQSSQWQTALSDGMADLTANVDHDLRARMRELITEAQEQIDEGDPAKMWEEFERRLYHQSTAHMVTNYELLRKGTQALEERVGAVFQDEEGTVVADIDIEAPTTALEAMQGKAEFDPEKTSVVERAFSALRGGQSGLFMFGMLGGVVGFALSGPVLIAVGLLMAGKSIRQDKKRQLTARRQQARASVRKYLDEVAFEVGKESRDSLRSVQRALRDHYLERAAERRTSTQQALQAAHEAVQSDQKRRRQRLEDVQAELRRLDALAKRVNAL